MGVGLLKMDLLAEFTLVDRELLGMSLEGGVMRSSISRSWLFFMLRFYLIISNCIQ